MGDRSPDRMRALRRATLALLIEAVKEIVPAFGPIQAAWEAYRDALRPEDLPDRVREMLQNMRRDYQKLLEPELRAQAGDTVAIALREAIGILDEQRAFAGGAGRRSRAGPPEGRPPDAGAGRPSAGAPGRARAVPGGADDRGLLPRPPEPPGRAGPRGHPGAAGAAAPHRGAGGAADGRAGPAAVAGGVGGAPARHPSPPRPVDPREPPGGPAGSLPPGGIHREGPPRAGRGNRGRPEGPGFPSKPGLGPLGPRRRGQDPDGGGDRPGPGGGRLAGRASCLRSLWRSGPRIFPSGAGPTGLPC
jgi:hypothetical protein